MEHNNNEELNQLREFYEQYKMPPSRAIWHRGICAGIGVKRSECRAEQCAVNAMRHRAVFHKGVG